MKLSLNFIPKWTKKHLLVIEELSFHLSKLYNIINYDFRQSEYENYFETEKSYKDKRHRQYLHSHNYQQGLKLLDQDWKSYFASLKDFKKNPQKYKGDIRKPGFKNTKRKSSIIFTKYAIRFKDDLLILSLSKKMQEKFHVKSLNLTFPKKMSEHVEFESIQQIRLNWINSEKTWKVIIIYKKDEKSCSLGYENIMSIDLGLDNLCAITFKNDKESYLIDGKLLKSKNSYFNKEIKRLTSQRMLETGNKKFIRTNKLTAIQRKRNNVINDSMHKISRKIIELCIEKRCKVILVGDIKDIKQNSKIKSFVEIPINILVRQIEYKAKLFGIELLKVKEHYTSGVSAYDLEKISKENYNKKRRIKRGLFKTNEGYLVNSDINGSLNIMRRYFEKNEENVVPMSIRRLRDNGCLDHPVRLRIS